MTLIEGTTPIASCALAVYDDGATFLPVFIGYDRDGNEICRYGMEPGCKSLDEAHAELAKVRAALIADGHMRAEDLPVYSYNRDRSGAS